MSLRLLARRVGHCSRHYHHHRQRLQPWREAPAPSHAPPRVPHFQSKCAPQAPFQPMLHRFRESVLPLGLLSRPLSPAAWDRSSRKGLVTWYLGMINTRPVLTKSVTAGFIFAAADVASQMITSTSSDHFNSARTWRMAGYGFLVLGPILHLWFRCISRCLPKRDMISTLKKIFIGQTLFGPVMTAVFFSTNAALQGENCSEIISRLKRDLLPTMKNGLIYWPAADFITFKFVPVRLQPVVCNIFSFFWTIYLTQTASSKKASSDESSATRTSSDPINSLRISEGNTRKNDEAWIL